MAKTTRTTTLSGTVKPIVLLTIRLLTIGAMAVAGYLAWISLSTGTVAGCGPESGCAKVLGSRWAYWFGVPVSLLAMAIYTVILVGTLQVTPTVSVSRQRTIWLCLVPCAVAILAGAAWFFLVQFFVIKSLCPYCIVAHSLGGAAALLILFKAPSDSTAYIGHREKEPETLPPLALPRFVLIGLAGAGILVAGQLIHQPKTHDVHSVAAIANTNAAAGTESSNSAVAVSLPPPKPVARMFSIYNGLFQFDLEEVPLTGSPRAPHVFVSLFDYTCHHCRQMHPLLTTVQQNLSNRVSIVNLPMPLDSECNQTVTRTPPNQINACQYARLGLAVWRARRQAFETYNHWFFEPEHPLPIESVRAYAENLVGSNALAHALQDPWVNEQLKANIAIYEIAYRAGRGRMPQLIIGTNVYTGSMSMEDLGRYVALELWAQ
jgi:uncharacterized membrane protein